jgi:hypothetical protein
MSFSSNPLEELSSYSAFIAIVPYDEPLLICTRPIVGRFPNFTVWPILKLIFFGSVIFYQYIVLSPILFILYGDQ